MDGKTKPFIILTRKLFHDPIWTKERFSYGQAWIDLIYFAYHSDGNFKHDGKRYDLKRGQLCHSEKFLCERWKWSRSRLRNTLRKWMECGQISIHNQNKFREHIIRTNFKKARDEKSQKEILQSLKNQKHLNKVAELYKN